jgi:hypothetical protein
MLVTLGLLLFGGAAGATLEPEQMMTSAAGRF